MDTSKTLKRFANNVVINVKHVKDQLIIVPHVLEKELNHQLVNVLKALLMMVLTMKNVYNAPNNVKFAKIQLIIV